MVTTNVFQRMFKIRVGDSQGSAFSIERQGRQYLVTARHVLGGVTQLNAIDVWYEEQWRSINLEIVGIGDGLIDVVVLTAKFQVSPTYPLCLNAAGLALSQPAYLLGFPFGQHSSGAEINRGLPLPLVKSGIISSMQFGDIKQIYIDAYANEGFSGGSVVFQPQHGFDDPHELRVAGVISGCLEVQKQIWDDTGNCLGATTENTGIAVAVDAQHVADLIDANQIGFRIQAD